MAGAEGIEIKATIPHRQIRRALARHELKVDPNGRKANAANAAPRVRKAAKKKA